MTMPKSSQPDDFVVFFFFRPTVWVRLVSEGAWKGEEEEFSMVVYRRDAILAWQFCSFSVAVQLLTLKEGFCLACHMAMCV